MFEKGMDKRMIYYHGRAIVGGCGLFVLLLVIKDVLADLEVIRVDGVSTIMDMLMLLVGTFSAFTAFLFIQSVRIKRELKN